MSAAIKPLLQKGRELAGKAFKGEWSWQVSESQKSVKLLANNNHFVMGFARWGTQGAMPLFQSEGVMRKVAELSSVIPGREHHELWCKSIKHPDAEHIAFHSGETMLKIYDLIDRLEKENRILKATCDELEGIFK